MRPIFTVSWVSNDPRAFSCEAHGSGSLGVAVVWAAAGASIDWLSTSITFLAATRN
jgi:hypothetical protein